MYKSTLAFTLVIMGLWAPVCVGAGSGGLRPVPPVILSASMDYAERAMVISGHYFGNGSPAVTLAGRALKVKTSSENRIVVALPAGIEPGTYSLTVTTGAPHRLASGPFNAVFFAVAAR